jgi:ADP-glucose pyrophosphorylase
VVEVVSAFKSKQEPLEMETRSFIDQCFVYGEAQIGDASGLVGAVIDSENEIAKAEGRVSLGAEIET